MKPVSLILIISFFAFAGCATLSNGSAGTGRSRPDRAELETAVQSLERENSRLNRELQNLRLESERLKNRGASMDREVERLKSREEELLQKLSSNEQRQRAVESRLSETEDRLSEIISGRESREEELKKIADDLSASLRGLGLFTVRRSSGEVRVILPAVLEFTSGGVGIVEGGRPILRALASALERYPGKNVVIEGHTDDVPISRVYSSNWELSFARALAVIEFLEAEGVDPMRMSAAGYGKYRPAASNATASGRAENRRVEIVFRSG